MLSAWFQAVGDSVWALRYLSLMLGVLLVPITALLSRRWFGDRVAITAAWLVAASPILWVYSQEIRAYITTPIYALLLLILLEHLLRDPPPKGSEPKRRKWLPLLAIIGIELLSLYTHNLSVPLVAWLNVVAVVAWIARRQWRRLLVWLASQTILALAYLPWVLTQRPTGSALNTPPAFTAGIIWGIWQSYFAGIQALLHTNTLLMALSAALACLALIVIIAALVRKWSLRLTLLVSQAVLLPMFELLLIMAAHIDFHPRYFIAGVPALLTLIGVGVEAIRSTRVRTTKQSHKHPMDTETPSVRNVWPIRFSRIAQATLLLLATVTCVYVIRLVVINPVYRHDDFRTMAEHYSKLTSQDIIVVPYGWEPTLAYYASKLNIQARIVTVPLGSSWQTIAALFNGISANHIEVLNWYQLPADLRGAYACLLGAATREAPEVFTVAGLTSQRYSFLSTGARSNSGLVMLQPLSEQPVSFGLLSTSQTQMLIGERKMCVITTWTLKSNVTSHESFRVTTELLNTQGLLLDQSDGDIRTDQQIPTQFWSSGTSGASLTLLEYPIGMPAGNYPLSLGVYGSSSHHSLDVLQGETPVGQTAIIGSPYIAPATPDEIALATLSFISLTQHLAIALTDGPSQMAMQPFGNGCTLQPGQAYPLAVLWRNTGVAAEPMTIGLHFSDTSLEQHVSINGAETARLAWYAFTLPASLPLDHGVATLEADDADGNRTVLARCAVVASDHLFNPPPMQYPLGESYNGVASLAGFDLSSTDIQDGTAFTLTLHWLATDTPSVAYTVFTHLLDSSGRVIAQDDSPPALGQRPTTGWVKGEFITDQHTLTFKTHIPAITGTTSLEVGLYDPVSGVRVAVIGDGDHIQLPIPITVRKDAGP